VDMGSMVEAAGDLLVWIWGSWAPSVDVLGELGV